MGIICALFLGVEFYTIDYFGDCLSTDALGVFSRIYALGLWPFIIYTLADSSKPL